MCAVKTHYIEFQQKVKNDPTIPEASLFEHLGSNRWTEEEHARFLDAIRKFGKDWDKVAEAVGKKDLMQCRNRYMNLLKGIRRNPEEADKERRCRKWTEEEHTRFIEAVRKYGKDWDRVAEALGNRTSG